MSKEEVLKTKLEKNPQGISVFSTGCKLIPYQLNNGKWAWVVSFFEDGTYFDGEEVNVNDSWSDDVKDLIGEPFDTDEE